MQTAVTNLFFSGDVITFIFIAFAVLLLLFCVFSCKVHGCSDTALQSLVPKCENTPLAVNLAGNVVCRVSSTQMHSSCSYYVDFSVVLFFCFGRAVNLKGNNTRQVQKTNNFSHTGLL